jgi:hypothetical protein
MRSLNGTSTRELRMLLLIGGESKLFGAPFFTDLA